MAGKGGKRSTSFTSATASIKKSRKHNKTKIKEAIGLDGWESLCDFIQKDGAVKYIQTLKTLKGKEFAIAYNAMAEYVKPKLQRATIDLKANISLSDQPITFE